VCIRCIGNRNTKLFQKIFSSFGVLINALRALVSKTQKKCHISKLVTRLDIFLFWREIYQEYFLLVGLGPFPWWGSCCCVISYFPFYNPLLGVFFYTLYAIFQLPWLLIVSVFCILCCYYVLFCMRSLVFWVKMLFLCTFQYIGNKIKIIELDHCRGLKWY